MQSSLSRNDLQKSPMPIDGRKRIVIERIIPSVDCGAFPLKRIIGQTMVVRAHVFSDGHERISVSLAFKHIAQSQWIEIPMVDLGNDEWEASFPLENLGIYEGKIIGWIDHFQNWLEKIHKLAENDEEIAVELSIGIGLLEKNFSFTQNKEIKNWIDNLKDERLSLVQRLHLAKNPYLQELVSKNPDRSLSVESDRPFFIFVERAKAQFSSWYEFFPRSWSTVPGRHGTFKECERLLPEIAAMGFDIVYLPPIHPIGKKARKGKNNALIASLEDVGSPWAIGSAEGGHKTVHPALGTLEDFKHFVNKAADYGIEVALDIAFQCSPDHPYLIEHPSWFKWRPDGSVQYAENPPKKYEDIVPFDFETEDWQALWEELKSIFVFWIEQGIRIFRVDNPHTKPLEFWRWVLWEIKKDYPDTLFLSEAFTRPKLLYGLAKRGFSQSYTYFSWRSEASEIRAYMEELVSPSLVEYFRPNFWPNTPDILPSYLQYAPPSVFKMRLVLAATLSSNYGIYGPAFELCINVPLEPGKEEYKDSEKYEIKHWDWDAPGNIKEFITKINHIRKNNLALQRTENIQFIQTDNPRLLAYLKILPGQGDPLLIVVNTSRNTEMGWVHFPPSLAGLDHSKPFQLTDLLADVTYTWHGEWNFVKLDPENCPAHIFRLSQDGSFSP
ncbi:alpha-1,4-glucan--maltose-1-phosphate maltosyltransferase [Methylacidiphilum caldifontis]|uniref:Alpha-1,4-glucan:maltose-1-phosphate maltosyltransferase n=1 Tax=Methylacidiphilum caldifontis TaxID=2795386 RepID=A0A4Y8PG78_9BACT|nr:alpha-1,4-glucan--maltose-1-phosphate maltosyltransferase [Methylacidiphilum caldifontis]QSR89582.1 alpha-1,4-glucan--maltose-1-phosphate maltosyltransferase [Methylacidiphilum caldifontis]TFE71146.1 alpha-amlyase [Methylacidiphilum caldifontis]